MIAEIAPLLGRLLLAEIDAPLMALLSHPDVAAVLDQAEPGCGAWLENEHDLDELAADYCDLFVLPGGLAPVAGAWAEGVDRQDFLHRLAMVFPFESEIASSFETPADHFGRLLTVLGRATSPDASWSSPLIDLVGPPMAAFGEALANHPTIPPYRACGRLLMALLPPQGSSGRAL
ncbi:MAG: molecular chaperone TorD family protein [Acidobacteriota bacterium]